MGILNNLVSVLSHLSKRNPSTGDNGQYSQEVIYSTTMGWTESYSISYRSTEIITITSKVPCLVTTSYTTTYVYDCDECHDKSTTTICSSKTCSAGPNLVEPTDYAPGESAPANVEDANANILGRIEIEADTCTTYYDFDSDADPDGLEDCGGGPEPPGATAVCVASPCYSLSVDQDTIDTTVTITAATPWPDGSQAPLANEPGSTPAEYCSEYVESGINGEWDGFQPEETCGNADDDDTHDHDHDDNDCGISVIDYAYVTDGRTIHTQTTIPQHGCGPYNNLSGLASRHDSSGVLILFYLWALSAVASALGMLLL